MSTWLYFLIPHRDPHRHVFVLKLRESLLNSLKITLKKKIVKSILRCRKTIDSPKNSFWKKQFCKEWSTHAVARTARGDNNNNTHLFSLLPVEKFKSFLNSRYKTHGKRCILCYWVMDTLGRCLGRISKFTRTRDIVYWRHQRAQ